MRCSDCNSKIAIAFSTIKCRGCSGSQCSLCRIKHMCSQVSSMIKQEQIDKLAKCQSIVKDKVDKI